jgi:hypothetical protein
MKKILVVGILLIPLMLIPIAFAGEPGPDPGAGYRLVGPSVDAVLGIINSSSGDVDVSLSGICNGQLFTLTLENFKSAPINLATVTVANIIGERAATAYFPQIAELCNPKPGLEFMIIDVKKFNKYIVHYPPIGQITADVTIMFVEATPNNK